MEQKIINLFNQHKITYVPIPTESLENIYELLINNKEFEPATDIEMLHIGIYWYIKNDIDKTIKYFMTAAQCENVRAMLFLANYYEEHEEFDNAIKYYFMTIATKFNRITNCSVRVSNIDDVNKYCPPGASVPDSRSKLINNLAYCFTQMLKFDDAIKCYQIGIEKGYYISMNNLAYCYEKIFKFDEAIKYYVASIKNGDVEAMNNLACHYAKISNFDDAIKYYLLAIDKGYVLAMNNLAYHYELRLDFDNMLKYFLMAAKCRSEYAKKKITNYYLEKCHIFDKHFFVYLECGRYELVNIFREIKTIHDRNINILASHFEYLPGAEGFGRAKYEFETKYYKLECLGKKLI